jgi:hypothetical protein
MAPVGLVIPIAGAGDLGPCYIYDIWMDKILDMAIQEVQASGHRFSSGDDCGFDSVEKK